jgi:uncharacterized protein (DUF2461 family)
LAPRTFGWLDGLSADNSKAYFHAHRDVFDTAVRGALEAMLEELADEHGGRVRLFRQHRDVRFSPDKSPDKTETYGVIAQHPASEAEVEQQTRALGRPVQLIQRSLYSVFMAPPPGTSRDGLSVKIVLT